MVVEQGFPVCACHREGLPHFWSRVNLVQVVRAIGIALSLSYLLQTQVDAATSDKSTSRPNIVLIMADDMGYGDISPYGGWIETPNLDRLAAEGTRFTDFHSSGNVCSPTRAGLMTGRYQQRAGIPGVVFADPKREQHQHGLQDHEITIAELLSQAGYATGIFGKWHLGYFPRYNPVNHGFDDFRGYVSGNIDFFSHYDQAGNYDWWHGTKPIEEDGYVTHLIDRHSVGFIHANKDRPFFLYIPHEAPHYPFQGPNDKGFRTKGNGRSGDQKLSIEQIRDKYRQMVEELDKNVGNVIDTLRELDLASNTFVFFLSDNGAAGKYGNNTPLRGAKGSNWEGGHRVPAIAWWPGRITADATTDQLAISLDLLPTVLELAGVSCPDGHRLDGVSLKPLLLDRRPPVSRKLFWNGVAMRDGPWKLMARQKGVAKGPLLFNLDEDLGEQQDVADAHPDRVRSMQSALDAWKRDVADGATVQPSS